MTIQHCILSAELTKTHSVTFVFVWSRSPEVFSGWDFHRPISSCFSSTLSVSPRSSSCASQELLSCEVSSQAPQVV